MFFLFESLLLLSTYVSAIRAVCTCDFITRSSRCEVLSVGVEQNAAQSIQWWISIGSLGVSSADKVNSRKHQWNVFKLRGSFGFCFVSFGFFSAVVHALFVHFRQLDLSNFFSASPTANRTCRRESEKSNLYAWLLSYFCESSKWPTHTSQKICLFFRSPRRYGMDTFVHSRAIRMGREVPSDPWRLEIKAGDLKHALNEINAKCGSFQDRLICAYELSDGRLCHWRRATDGAN